MFTPIPLPGKVLQTSDCTHLLFKNVVRTGLGMGMGMNGTADAVPVPVLRGSYIIVTSSVMFFLPLSVRRLDGGQGAQGRGSDELTSIREVLTMSAR